MMNSSVTDHYQVMGIDNLNSLPVKEIADENCVLFLWVTMPKLNECFDLIKAWGFEYKTCAFSWVKLNKLGEGYFMGQGRWTRGNTELCLLATKGKISRINAGIRQLCVSPVREHSQKPDEIRERIVALLGDLPRIELFARERVDGWEAWGNEVESEPLFRMVEVRKE